MQFVNLIPSPLTLVGDGAVWLATGQSGWWRGSLVGEGAIWLVTGQFGWWQGNLIVIFRFSNVKTIRISLNFNWEKKKGTHSVICVYVVILYAFILWPMITNSPINWASRRKWLAMVVRYKKSLYTYVSYITSQNLDGWITVYWWCVV